MEMDPATVRSLKEMGPRRAYEAVKQAVLQNPWGASSEDLRSALGQAVEAGILSWEDVEGFEGS
jgi:hypothetical protein